MTNGNEEPVAIGPYYDDIPPNIIKGDILDIGAGWGQNQVMGKNGRIFVNADRQGRYLGIDCDIARPALLNIEEHDFFEFMATKQYDTVLAIHFIEHIPIELWSVMFERMTAFLKDGGLLILGAPYLESPQVYRDHMGPEHYAHKVFLIDKELLEQFLLIERAWIAKGFQRFLIEGKNPVYHLRKLIWWLRKWFAGIRHLPFGIYKSFLSIHRG